MPFEELEHTADVRIRVRGESIPHLFGEAARAMFQTMYGTCTNPSISRTVTLECADTECLLADLLSELLFISEVEDVVFCSFAVEIEGTRLRVEGSGEPLDPTRHTGREIKGISYSGLRIQERDGEYLVEIIFDV